MKAIILILKHATLSQLSNIPSEAALAQVAKDYQIAKIDSKIQQFLATTSQKPSVEEFASFVMAIDISMFYSCFTF